MISDPHGAAEGFSRRCFTRSCYPQLPAAENQDDQRLESSCQDAAHSALDAPIQLAVSRLEELASIAALELEPENRRNIIPQALDAHLACHRSGTARYLSILQAGHLVGFMILGLEQTPQSVELRRIVVASKGKGIGSFALGLLENYCTREWGACKIWLDVFQDNLAAIRFYGQNGYARVGTSMWQDRTLWLFEKACG